MKAKIRAKVHWSKLEDPLENFTEAQRQAWFDIVEHAGRLREWNTGYVLITILLLAELRERKRSAVSALKLRTLRSMLRNLGIPLAARSKLTPPE